MRCLHIAVSKVCKDGQNESTREGSSKDATLRLERVQADVGVHEKHCEFHARHPLQSVWEYIKITAERDTPEIFPKTKIQVTITLFYLRPAGSPTVVIRPSLWAFGFIIWCQETVLKVSSQSMTRRHDTPCQLPILININVFSWRNIWNIALR